MRPRGLRSMLLFFLALTVSAGCPDLHKASAQETLQLAAFTESDPTGRVTMTADCVSFANLETRNALSYVYAERLVEGDFTFDFDTMLTGSDTFSGETAVWGLSNTEATTYDNWSGGVTVSYYVAGGVPRLELENQTNHFADNSINLTLNQRYYLTVSRSGGTVTAKIFSDPARAVLVDTMVRADIGTGSFGFVYALSGDNNNTANNYRASGDACRFTTGAGGIPPPAGLAAPVLNSAQPGNGQVTLGWSSVSGAGGYKVKYGTSSGVYSATIDAGNVLNYTVTGLANGTGYYFAVLAYDAQEDSPLSNEKSAVPALPAAVDLITNIQYNAAGQITRMDYANGTVVTYQYNRLNNRLVNKKTVNPAGDVLQDLSYDYDNGGNILAIHDRVHTANQTFEYDALNRLTRAQGDSYNTKTYAYDEVGNITQKDGVYYAYGEDGAGPHAVTSLSSGARFAYDANGNMSRRVKDGITTDYLYDRENRLVEVKKNGAYAGKYEYDGDGGRTKKTVYGATIDTTVYVGSLFEMTEGRKTAHIYMGSQRIAAVMDGQLKYYFDDHLGGVNVVTDATGGKEELTEYTPFGSFARSENYSLNDQTDRYYTGQRLDTETGLYYYNARYYDPELGRFIQADTMVPGYDNPQTLNRYSYCLNNPVNRIDPSGNWSFKKWFKKVFGDFGQIMGLAASTILGPVGFYGFIGASVYTNNWEPLKNMALNAASGFIFGGPVGAAMSMVSGAVMDTPQGRDLTRWSAEEIYDDILGFHPSTAYILASIDLNMTGTFILEKVIANAVGSPVRIKNNLSNKELVMARNGEYIADENVFGPSLKSKNARFDAVKGLIEDGKLVGSFQRRLLDVPGLKQLGAQHTSANVLNIVSAPKVNPLSYAAWGTCHEATNLTLLKAGISSTILDLGASWDMYVTAAVYGTYGGQLGNRILAGVNAFNSNNRN